MSLDVDLFMKKCKYHILVVTFKILIHMKGDYMSQKKKIKENILQMNASYIVTDPSGTTLKSLADHGYKIQILNLMDRSPRAELQALGISTEDLELK